MAVSLSYASYFIYQNTDVTCLPNFQPPLPVCIYTREGIKIGEFGPRSYQKASIDNVPILLKQAIIAIEDKRFFKHRGIDFEGLLRATFELILTRRKAQGGSTITMQVARNYFLSHEKTFRRKFKEMIIAYKIERYFGKQEILELYLNKIYMGHRTVGIVSATEFYYQKSLNDLTLAEIALLTGMPQAPALLNPITNLEESKKRRDLVLYRLYELNYITKTAYENALDEKVHCIASTRKPYDLSAEYVAQMAKEQTMQLLGENSRQGLHVYTTIEARAQNLANHAVTTSLLEYDQRHGYRGPEKRFKSSREKKALVWLDNTPIVSGLIPAIVVKSTQDEIKLLLKDGEIINLSAPYYNWMLTKEKPLPCQWLGIGDAVRVYRQNHQWRLGQIPEAQGALVALHPDTGALLALSGGFNYTLSQFNRAIHAMRQTGSTLKPFIYAAALEKGYNLSDVFNDGPLVFEQSELTPFWCPQNATKSFSGLTRLRVALEMSVNLVTIRVLESIGIQSALQLMRRCGFETKAWPVNLSLALGSVESTPLQMAESYAVFANGGYKVSAYLIDHIVDNNNQLLYVSNSKDANEEKLYERVPVISEEIAFLITSALKGVIPYNNFKLHRELKGANLAGKTGTTNDSKDSWFVGYNEKCVASVWMGIDQGKPLYEYAHSTALPLWTNFMKNFSKSTSIKPPARPSGITILPINAETGIPIELNKDARVHTNSKNIFYEYFQTKTLHRYEKFDQQIHEPLF